MRKVSEIVYLGIEKNKDYNSIIDKVLKTCFETEHIENPNLYITITLTNPEEIRKINKKYRNIDKQTDVLSFPMYEKQEIEKITKSNEASIDEVLGDIVISIEQVKKQAKDYGHSFERELAYMVVHGFYHLMGEDHIEEKDKKIMRQKEEIVLKELKINR